MEAAPSPAKRLDQGTLGMLLDVTGLLVPSYSVPLSAYSVQWVLASLVVIFGISYAHRRRRFCFRSSGVESRYVTIPHVIRHPIRKHRYLPASFLDTITQRSWELGCPYSSFPCLNQVDPAFLGIWCLDYGRCFRVVVNTTFISRTCICVRIGWLRLIPSASTSGHSRGNSSEACLLLWEERVPTQQT